MFFSYFNFICLFVYLVLLQRKMLQYQEQRNYMYLQYACGSVATSRSSPIRVVNSMPTLT
jgi:hypothetical protein